MIESSHSSGNSSLLQIELISSWISERTVLPSALTNSAGICSMPVDQSLFSFSTAISKSEALGSGTRGFAACIFLCLTSLNPCTFNSCEKCFHHIAKILRQSVNKSPFSSFITLVLGRKPLLKLLMPLYKSLIFFISLLFPSSSILDFRYSFFIPDMSSSFTFYIV